MDPQAPQLLLSSDRSVRTPLQTAGSAAQPPSEPEVVQTPPMHTSPEKQSESVEQVPPGLMPPSFVPPSGAQSWSLKKHWPLTHSEH